MKYLTLITLTICQYSFGQIWYENFQGDVTQNDQVDNGPTAWTTSCDGCNATVGPPPDFHVDGNGFKWLDTDAEGTWFSETIDLTTDIDISISVEVQADNTNDPQDYIIFEYSLDGGTFSEFTTNGNLHSDFGNLTASIGPFNANSLQIRIRGYSDDIADAIKMDNILVTGTSILPVTFISFNATDQNNSHELNWVIGSESFNNYFFVSSSEDGYTFKEILRVDSKGDTQQEREYTSTISSSNEVNYLRLSQVDYNGEISHLKTISISGTSEPFIKINNKEIIIENIKKGNALIFNSSGKILYSQSIKNPIINLSNLPDGLYIIHVQTVKGIIKLKFVL